MITVENAVSWEQLEERVRATTLMGMDNHGQPIYPYEDATIGLQRVSYDEVLPTTLYAIRRNLAVQVAINADLASQEYDALELEGGLILRGADGEVTTMVPPIVEETDYDGQYILDGAHRTSVGLWSGREGFTSIHISGIRPDCPSYAVPNQWNEITIYDAVPTNPHDKKRYRTAQYRDLYRNFSLLNGSQMREPTSHVAS